MFSPLVQF
jgi:hypothetical protein